MKIFGDLKHVLACWLFAVPITNAWAWDNDIHWQGGVQESPDSNPSVLQRSDDVPMLIRFGANGTYAYRVVSSGSYQCTNGFFGVDPVPGVKKWCEYVLLKSGSPSVWSIAGYKGDTFRVIPTTPVACSASAPYSGMPVHTYPEPTTVHVDELLAKHYPGQNLDKCWIRQPTPNSMSTTLVPALVPVASENGSFYLTKPTVVVFGYREYGVKGRYTGDAVHKTLVGWVNCSTATFGNPVNTSGNTLVYKACHILNSAVQFGRLSP